MNSIDSAMRTLTTSLNAVKADMSTTQKELATNKRNLDATDTGIMVRIQTTIDSYNTVDSKLAIFRSAVDTSKSGLAQISSLVASLTSLAQEAVNDTSLSASDLTSLDSQFQSFLTQINTAVATSSYDGFSFLSNSTVALTPGTQTIQVGPSASQTWSATKANASLATLGLATPVLSLTTVANATTALANLQTAATKIGVSQQTLEKIGTTLDGFVKNNLAAVDTYNSSADQISKPDASALQVQLNQLNDQQSINYYVISQINTEASAIMQIFR